MFGVDDGKGVGLGTSEPTFRKASEVLNLIILAHLLYAEKNAR